MTSWKNYRNTKNNLFLNHPTCVRFMIYEIKIRSFYVTLFIKKQLKSEFEKSYLSCETS